MSKATDLFYKVDSVLSEDDAKALALLHELRELIDNRINELEDYEHAKPL